MKNKNHQDLEISYRTVKVGAVKLFNRCLIEAENISDEWNLVHISSIYKKRNKKTMQELSRHKCDHFYGEMYAKHCRGTENRIEAQTNEIEAQNDFHARRFCTDTFVINQLFVNNCKKFTQTSHVLDQEKADDSVPRNKLLDILDKTELKAIERQE